MHHLGWAGSVLTLAGLAGYAVGTTTPYPGRAFSVTSVMIGVTLVAISKPTEGAVPEDPSEASE
jgi:hypothetical protein